MRKLLIVLASLLVAFVATAGIASAGTGKHCDDNGVPKTNQNCLGGVDTNPTGGLVAPGSVAPVRDLRGYRAAADCPGDRNAAAPGCQRPGAPGGNFDWRRSFPSTFPQNAFYNNSLLNLQLLGLTGVDVSSVPVCTYTDWTSFDRFGSGRFGSGRWGNVRNHFGPNPTAAWMALRQQANCQAVVNAQLQLLNGNLINLSQYGIVGGAQVNVCAYQTWNDFDTFGSRRWGNSWNGFRGRYFHSNPLSEWNQLRAQARCSAQVAPPVVIAPSSDNSNSAPQTVTEQAAPQTVTQAPPPVVIQSAPQVVTVPNTSHGVDTGDGSFPLGL